MGLCLCADESVMPVVVRVATFTFDIRLCLCLYLRVYFSVPYVCMRKNVCTFLYAKISIKLRSIAYD